MHCNLDCNVTEFKNVIHNSVHLALCTPIEIETELAMFLFSKNKTTQREYIDLIKGASEKWVNWLAPKNIHVSPGHPFQLSLTLVRLTNPPKTRLVTLAPSIK